MTGREFRMIVGLLVVGEVCAAQRCAVAQTETWMRQEVVPAPDSGYDAPLPGVDYYGPTRAYRDSYEYADRERQAAVERQALLMQGMYFAAFPYYSPLAYYPLPLPAYVYGPESARRAARTAARHGYPYPPAYRGVVVSLPGVPAGIAARPNAASPAPGNGKTWVSPDGYVYRPWSATVPPGDGPMPETSPAVPEQVPIPAPDGGAKRAEPVNPSAPEAVPTPRPSIAGPRQF